MSDAEGHAGHFRAPPLSARALGFVLLAAALIGVGLLMVMAWIVSLGTDWYWALGLLPVTAGSVMLFLPASGPDHA